VRVADDSDDLPRAFSESWSGTGADEDAISQRIASRPEMMGECLVDDDDCGRRSVILPGECAAALQRNLQSVEVAIGDGAEAGAA